MELKKTVKYDGKIKGVRIIDGILYDKEGNVVDLITVLQKVYGDSAFDLSTTTKTEENIDLDSTDEEYDYSSDDYEE